ncbi:selenide, water dikinase SelD [Candidatus Sumerlaeota bacterium]|nr:selenide, water dikinase SelD [Candidatus Sumerlaeota bacterium]
MMSRSLKLGHCVCNPKTACPCETYVRHNVCPCAGEKLPVSSDQTIPLTREVRKAGCASKIGQADLQRLLAALPAVTDPNVLVGTAAGDDAGIYRLNGSQCLVQTVDVFTPCVDDPYLFGQIAAANSVSDVYAMGGRPICALSIAGFPIDRLDGGILSEILRGGVEKLNEADCALVGGHSINDEEVKVGFAVTGLIDADRVIERGKARAGDVLALTKPLGSGMVSFGAQIGRIHPDCLAEVGQWMAALNRRAAELMLECGASACTDVTGFGLMGHLVEMARSSGLSAEIDLEAVPVFGVVPDCIAAGVIGGAVERNMEYAMAWVEADPESERLMPIVYDAQTSGGLLVALAPDDAKRYVDALREGGNAAASIIGRLDAGAAGRVKVRGSRLENRIGEGRGIQMAANDDSAEEACCPNPPGAVDSDALFEGERTFATFMREANRPGRVGAREKRLMSIALSVAQKCEPCLKIHMRKALDEGIPLDEIEEAAWLAISFAGSPAMMLYREIRGQIVP